MAKTFIETDSTDFPELLKKYRATGQPVAVICNRYVYRGLVSGIGSDHFVLEKPWAISATGKCQSDKAADEEPIGSSIAIRYSAIEIVFQPDWAFAPLEVGYEP